MRRIPHIHQRNNYFCGPAVIQMVLRAHGIHATKRELAKRSHTNARIGTSTRGLVRALASFGLMVRSGEHLTIPDLKRALARDQIIIVCYTEVHWNWGHYSIVAGFSKNSIRLLDPAERLGSFIDLPVQDFIVRWRDPLFTKSNRWAAFVSAPTPRR